MKQLFVTITLTLLLSCTIEPHNIYTLDKQGVIISISSSEEGSIATVRFNTINKYVTKIKTVKLFWYNFVKKFL